ncbi:MAG: glycosyltransferase family protein, partial [Alphaproteobacteria bacterium]
MTVRVFFYVQHLLGIGHLKRAATLTRAMRADGMAATLVTGGAPVRGLDTGGADILQLPWIRAVDKYFKVLVDETGTEIDEAFKAAREAQLLAAFDEIRPDVVLIELFPFGRRQLRHELLPLLDAARARASRPAILCSVRDILVQSPKPERVEEMLAWARTYFDGVLVHGDPDLIPFEATFPLASRISDLIRYTGYVVDRRAAQGGGAGTEGRGEVIVSTGGGAVSEPLLAAALPARALSRAADLPWRVLVGDNLFEDRFNALRAEAPPGMIVERARPDFTRLIAGCALSVSQGGYNTVLEVLSAGRRAVVVPYAGGLETEQTLRARLLAERGLIHQVAEDGLDPA